MPVTFGLLPLASLVTGNVPTNVRESLQFGEVYTFTVCKSQSISEVTLSSKGVLNDIRHVHISTAKRRSAIGGI